MGNDNPSNREIEKLSKKLMYTPKLVWDTISFNERKKIFRFGEEYKRFLDQAKTEREAVICIREMARNNGFSEGITNRDPGPMLKSFHEKSIALTNPGRTPS